MPKRTYQPKNLKRLKKFGFMARNKTNGGKNVMKSRALKGRKVLTVSDEYRIKAKKHKDKIK